MLRSQPAPPTSVRRAPIPSCPALDQDLPFPRRTGGMAMDRVLDGDRCGAPRERSTMTATRPVVAMPLTDELLAAIRKRVADAFPPEPIILFGSYADGRPTSDSDLDLLFVTTRPLGREERLTRTGIAYPAARKGELATISAGRTTSRSTGWLTSRTVR